jgi:putative DNA primase/helicase
VSGIQLVTVAHRKLDGKIDLAIVRSDNQESIWSGVVDLSCPADVQRVAAVAHEKILGIPTKSIEKQLQAIAPSGLDLIDSDGRLWTKPRALPDPLPEVMPYDSDLLPACVEPAVADVAYRMQCPPDYIACAVLVAMGAVVGNRIGIRPKQKDSWLVIPNLWGCIIGRPSMKKSPSASYAENLIRWIEDRDRKRIEPMIADSKRDALLAEKKRKAMEKDLNDAIKDKQSESEQKRIASELVSIAAIQPPTSRRIITTDSTIEKLIEMLNEHPLGMILWRDELISWIRGLDKDDQAGVRQQFLTLWNGYGRINVDRIGRGETVCESPCLSIFGCATPGGIQEYVQGALRGGRGDDGLLQRFQVTVWPDEPSEIKVIDSKPNQSALDRVRDLFERLAGFDVRDIADDQCEPSEIPWIRFEPSAQEVFNDWLESKTQRCRSESMPEAIESHLAKFDKLVPAIALLIELCDGCKDRAVSKRSVQRAVRWAQYLESHAMRLYAVAACPERVVASPLLSRLIGWDKDRPIRVREIKHKGWRGLSDPKVIESTLEALEADGWLQSIEDGKTPRGGRSTMTYFLHPEAKKWIEILGDGTTKTTKTPDSDGDG